MLAELAAERQFEFAAERAVFLTVLHRLFVSGSDRAAEKWRADYRIDGTEGLSAASSLPRHGLARRTARRSRPQPARCTPRCCKDRVEEELFARRRDLFAELSVVFMDTTSLSFEGQGGAELGRCGHSKDHRPDLHQMIVGLVMRSRTAGRCAASCGPVIPPMSPPSCRSSPTGCGRGLASAASASSPTAAA